MGKCIDHPEYHEGFDPDAHIKNLQADIDKLRKQQQQQGERQKQQTDLNQKHATVDALLKDGPLRYFELVQQAGDNLGIDPNKPGRGGKMKIKFEIMRILEL